jgi:membrane protein
MINATEELSTAQLVHHLTEQTTTLIRQEVRLAQLELSVKAKRAGIGVGALAAAGIVAFFAAGVLLAAAVLGLATVVDDWLAALIVAGALLLLTAVLGLVGKTLLGKAAPPAPVEAIASAREDLAVLKKAAHR